MRWKLLICLKSCAQKLQLGLREKSYILLLGLVPLSLFLNCFGVTLLYLYEFFFLFPFVRWFFFQWMVVNYKQFVPNQPLAPDTFWVLEQLPGTVMMADMSEILDNERYWASYNLPLVWFTLWLVPPPPCPRQKQKSRFVGSQWNPFCFLHRYFPEIYNLSGQPENVKKYGPWFDYHLNPRAQIFKRDQGKVNDLSGFITLMRYACKWSFRLRVVLLTTSLLTS